MKKVQKGFTLVELIVVITILAILGTIAFISLQGYSQDAKNSKVVNDVASIAKVIELETTNGKTLSSMVASYTGAKDVDIHNGTSTDSTFGSGLTMSGAAYNVGNIDFLVLKQNPTDFRTEGGSDMYFLGVLSNTVNGENYSYYQVVGQEGPSDGLTAVVKGNYLYNSAVALEETGLVAQSLSGAGLEQGDAITSSLY